MRFQDKVVLITGGASGIGAATALEFAKEGAKISILDRNPDYLTKIVTKLHEAGLKDENIFTLFGDATNPEDQNKIVDGTIKQFGHIDILVNNAGWLIQKNIQESTIEDLDKMMDIHLRAPFCITKRALHSLIQRKGAVVNVSSISAIQPVNMTAGYSIAKAALGHFTRVLALELMSKGVRVSTVNPGLTLTNLMGDLDSDKVVADGKTARQLMEDKKKLGGRINQPEDIARVILFLSLPESNMITGVQLPVDGGTVLSGRLWNNAKI